MVAAAQRRVCACVCVVRAGRASGSTRENRAKNDGNQRKCERFRFFRPLRGQCRRCAQLAAKKVTFPQGEGRFCDPELFSDKKPVGSSFHVILMQVHDRTGPVAVAGLEKMLAKVPWALGDVDLYLFACGRPGL